MPPKACGRLTCRRAGRGRRGVRFLVALAVVGLALVGAGGVAPGILDEIGAQGRGQHPFGFLAGAGEVFGAAFGGLGNAAVVDAGKQHAEPVVGIEAAGDFGGLFLRLAGKGEWVAWRRSCSAFSWFCTSTSFFRRFVRSLMDYLPKVTG